MNNGLDIKNFKAKLTKGLVSLTKGENGTVKVIKKRVDEDGEPIQPFEMITSPEHFDDILIDNKMKILQERKEIAGIKIQIAARERDLDEREDMLEKDAADLRKEIEKTLKAEKAEK